MLQHLSQPEGARVYFQIEELVPPAPIHQPAKVVWTVSSTCYMYSQKFPRKDKSSTSRAISWYYERVLNLRGIAVNIVLRVGKGQRPLGTQAHCAIYASMRQYLSVLRFILARQTQGKHTREANHVIFKPSHLRYLNLLSPHNLIIGCPTSKFRSNWSLSSSLSRFPRFECI